MPQNRGVYREKPKNLEKTLTMERKTNNKFNPHNVPWPDSYQRGNVRGVGVISWGVLPIIAHMGRLRPKGVGISLVEVYKRVEKSVIRICKRAQKG